MSGFNHQKYHDLMIEKYKLIKRLISSDKKIQDIIDQYEEIVCIECEKAYEGSGELAANFIEVTTLADFGTPVDGVIYIANKFFILLNPIICPYTLAGGNFHIYDPTLGKNSLTFTSAITAIVNIPDIGIIYMTYCTISGNENAIFNAEYSRKCGYNQNKHLRNTVINPNEVTTCQN